MSAHLSLETSRSVIVEIEELVAADAHARWQQAVARRNELRRQLLEIQEALRASELEAAEARREADEADTRRVEWKYSI